MPGFRDKIWGGAFGSAPEVICRSLDHDRVVLFKPGGTVIAGHRAVGGGLHAVMLQEVPHQRPETGDAVVGLVQREDVGHHGDVILIVPLPGTVAGVVALPIAQAALGIIVAAVEGVSAAVHDHIAQAVLAQAVGIGEIGDPVVHVVIGRALQVLGRVPVDVGARGGSLNVFNGK